MISEVVEYPFGDRVFEANLLYGVGALEGLKSLPDASVHMVCTSPPYWGLRAYQTQPLVWDGVAGCQHDWGADLPHGRRGNRGVSGTGGNLHPTLDVSGQGAGAGGGGNFCQVCGAWRGELGLEPTPDLYVEHLVQIFREVARVLRDDGTLWLNLGDTYAGGGSTTEYGQDPRNFTSSSTLQGKYTEGQAQRPIRFPLVGLKPKDLIGIPWRVAFALQEDGWVLRSDIIWEKKNPMPESVEDRPTKSHEYVFLLAKSGRYSYDAQAITEPAVCGDHPRTVRGLGKATRTHGQPPHKGLRSGFKAGQYYYDTVAIREPAVTGAWEAMPPIGGVKHTETTGEYNPTYSGNRPPGDGHRNKRTVWAVNTCPYPGAHFATFPPALILPMILAGTSAKGCCVECGAPWVRVVDRSPSSSPRHPSGHGAHCPVSHHPGQVPRWTPSCECDAGDPVPCTVLDPFSGSGTTGVVAVQNGRNYIGLDVQEKYLSLAKARLVGMAAPKDDEGADQRDGIQDLFG